MRHSRTLRLGAALAVGATTAVIFVAAPAGAGQVFRETIHEEATFVVTDHCGVPGLNVEVAFVYDALIMAVPHGPDGLEYFSEHGTRTEVQTNLANGKFITTSFKVRNKDLRVTDNGDGTLTILWMGTGTSAIYGADGKVIARDSGQSRFEVLVDHNGTPTDPFDDEFIADLGRVKGSTGRSDDFCEAVVPALS